MTNKAEAIDPLSINLPDGEKLTSTHTCEVDVPALPRGARRAHIVPGLAHSSLISLRVLCAEGCEVEMDNNHCYIKYEGKVIWVGIKEPSTDLWILPLKANGRPPTSKEDYITQRDDNSNFIHTANNVHQLTSRESVVKFLHQCLFSPPKKTLLKALANNQFPTWPFNKAAVEKYLPDRSPATDKGSMKRQRQGLRSTKRTPKELMAATLEEIETLRDYHPPMEEGVKDNHLFTYLGRVDKDGTIFVDTTGNFPLRSIDGMTTVLIVYDWTSNAILATPIENTKDETMVKVFQDQIDYLKKRGFKPTFNIIDNVASKAIREFLEKEDIGVQLVEPHNHRVNAAERAIQTFKNLFISGLATCDEHFPTVLWSRLIKQCQDSINMLRTSRVHPKVSAYHCLEGVHDFNRVPWAPPGTRATIFNPPEIRSSWGPRALDAWYVGPAWHHYRNWYFYVPSTGGFRTSGQASFYPQHCEVPRENQADEVRRLALTLTKAISRLRGEEDTMPGRHTAALQKLAAIFGERLARHASAPRERTISSTTPTAPANLRAAPRTHQRTTRRNTPGMLPPEARTLPPISEGGAPPTEGEGGTREGAQGPPSEGEEEMGRGQYSATEYYSQPRPARQQQQKRQGMSAQRRSKRLRGHAPEGEGETSRTERRRKRERAREKAEAQSAPAPTEPVAPSPQQHTPTPAPILTMETPARKRARDALHSPHIISQEAINFITSAVWNNERQHFIPRRLDTPNDAPPTPDIEQFCAPVVHPKTGEVITKYAKLANDPDPEISQTWKDGLGKEFGNMAQGDNKTGTKGHDAIHVLTHEQIAAIPKHKVITYARLVVDFRPQKKDPNRVRMTAGGNLIQYSGELTTRTADLTTAKIIWNSTISTPGARYACFDISNMYLHTPLAPEDYEYMRIPFKLFPAHTVEQYDLATHQKDGMVYVEIRRCIYGLPQAGALANKLLKERLAPAGYFEVRNTPGLFKHISRPIAFSLVVDDFGVKYVGREHADHLVNAIKKHYPISED